MTEARMSAYGNSVQQQAAASQMAAPNAGSNAYYNRLRSYSGEDTYQVSSRQSPRPGVPRRRPGLPQEPRSVPPSRPGPMPLEAFFLPDGALDWPYDAPTAGTLRSAQAEVEAAVRVVLSQVRAGGKARAHRALGPRKASWGIMGSRPLSRSGHARLQGGRRLLSLFPAVSSPVVGAGR